MKRIGKYLRVQRLEMPASRKTGVWCVLTNDGDRLGQIQWFGRWRQYTFDPAPHTTFNRGCLEDLGRFLEEINVAHRARMKA